MRWTALIALGTAALLTLSLAPRGANVADAAALEAGRPVAPEGMLMLWHDRAYGQLKLATLRKQADRGIEHAWLLAELANANGGHRGDAKYRAYADTTSKLATEIAAAMKKEDFTAARELLGKIDQQCIACHDQFRDDEQKSDTPSGG